MMPSFSYSPAIRWPRRVCGYEAMIEEVRFAEDSPLEEGVSCELVSGSQIPWLAGKIQGISSIRASAAP